MNGGSGAASPDGPSGDGGSAAWRRTYGRVEALLPQVEELAAGRARLEAANKAQRELSGAREDALEARLLQAEASRRRWRAAYTELPAGANPKLADLQRSDLEDSKTCDAIFDDNSQLQIQSKETVELSQDNAGHEDIARYLRAELGKIKQAYETLSSNKDKEVSALRAVKDFLWNQLRAMDKDNAALLKLAAPFPAAVVAVTDEHPAADEPHLLPHLHRASSSSCTRCLPVAAPWPWLRSPSPPGAPRPKPGRSHPPPPRQLPHATSTSTPPPHLAAQKLQQNIEELEVAAQKKDDEIARFRALAFDAEKKENSQKRQRASSMMHIFVKIHDGKTITLEVADSDTINSVKAKIQDKEGIPAGHLRLIGMQIFVKMLSSKITTLEVESSDTIHSVKGKIFDQTCMAPAGQRIFFADKLLEDDCTLAEYNIQNDSTVCAEFLFPLKRLRVSVETRTGKSIIEKHAFMRSETVDDVKTRIYAELGIPPDEQKLLVCGDLLEDGQPLFPEICGAGTLHLHL
ncbi:unnamed protein product [Alopecurus aequalis]